MHQQSTMVTIKRKKIATEPSSEREFLFDVKLFASIRLKARNRKEAEKVLRDALDCASCNAGAWPDGNPIVFEASIDGELDLVEVDGHPM